MSEFFERNRTPNTANTECGFDAIPNASASVQLAAFTDADSGLSNLDGGIYEIQTSLDGFMYFVEYASVTSRGIYALKPSTKYVKVVTRTPPNDPTTKVMASVRAA